MKKCILLALASAAAPVIFAQSPPAAESLTSKFKFLIGDWKAAGDTQIGKGEGGFSFQPEINGQVILRRNFAEYKSGTAAGTRHDDLMLIYAGQGDSAPQALYIDSEGHVIQYSVSFPSPDQVVFDSATQPGPKFRLSYRLEGEALNGKFEVAAPGEELKTYLEWKAHRTKRKAL